MARVLRIHPENPQIRLLNLAVETIQHGGVVAYPTDSAYALGCRLEDKAAADRIRALRQLDKEHNFTLMCRDLSELSHYAQISNPAFRLLKAYTPGPFTFVLPATHEVPRRLQHPKRKTIGLRIPDHPVVQEMLEVLKEPLMSVTLTLPGDDLPLTNREEIEQRIGKQIDLIVDGGYGGIEATTVVDLTGDVPKVLRQGKGEF